LGKLPIRKKNFLLSLNLENFEKEKFQKVQQKNLEYEGFRIRLFYLPEPRKTTSEFLMCEFLNSWNEKFFETKSMQKHEKERAMFRETTRSRILFSRSRR
jgi:hypothetical protein